MSAILRSAAARPGVSRVSVLVIPLVVLCLLALPAQGDPTKWDQAGVTKIAKELNTSCKELYNTSYKDPRIGGELPAGGPNQKEEFMQRLRTLREECNHLEKTIENGGTRSSTTRAFERIGEVKRDLEVLGRNLFLDDFVASKFKAFEEAYQRIAPYYDAAPDSADKIDGDPNS